MGERVGEGNRRGGGGGQGTGRGCVCGWCGCSSSRHFGGIMFKLNMCA